jgi:protein-tyrosine phosphatase
MTPTQLLPRVWIGDKYVSQDISFFETNNIGLVVNCTPTVVNSFPLKAKYLCIPVNDNSSTFNNDIMKMMLPWVVHIVLNFLSQYDSYGVLIHCEAGISRSCTVASAVVKECCTTSIKEAAAYVLTKHPIAFYYGFLYNFRSALNDLYGDFD